MTDLSLSHSQSSRKPQRQEPPDIAILVAWWFVVALHVSAFDLVSSRASYVSLYAIAVEHLWYVVVCTGLIGALYTDRNKLLWCFISAIGGTVTLGASVLVVTFVCRLLGG